MVLVIDPTVCRSKAAFIFQATSLKHEMSFANMIIIFPLVKIGNAMHCHGKTFQ